MGTSIHDASRTSVLLTIENKSFVLCSLTPGNIEQQPLDLTISEGEEVTFETTGENEVHLTGNFIMVDDESSDDEINEEDMDGLDLSDVTPEQLQELIDQGMLDPEDLMDDEDDVDYDSDDAEADSRIKEITEEEEAEMKAEAEMDGVEPEIKIKKQANKKSKRKNSVGETDEEVAAATAELSLNKKVKKEKKAKTEEDVKPKKEKKTTKQLAGGLVVETKKEGAGNGAKKGQRVGMYYIGKLTNGKVFDQNTKGKPLWFRLGAGEVIKGWDNGISGMKKGEERRLTIPAPLAYGKRGAPPDIPPNATLVFDIRLVEFK